jgi:hypothetical protein
MRSAEEIIEQAVTSFKCDVSQGQLAAYANTTVREVKQCIINIQNDREKEKSLMDLSRLETLVERFQQFDEACQAMEMGVPELSGFIWGPPAHILQVSLVWAE